MVYANDITNFNCTDAQLEERLLFWMLVAGKQAEQQAQKLEAFLFELWGVYIGRGLLPFHLVHCADRDGVLVAYMRKHGLGKYTVLERGFREVVKLDPRTCTLEQLEAVPGIGPKTARCFLLHSRPNQRLAGLDTHLLKWLASRGYDVPKTTPPAGKKYRMLEGLFLAYADRFGLEPADLDLRVWRFYAGHDPILDLAPTKAAA